MAQKNTTAKATEDATKAVEQIEAGDYVRVDLPSPANPFGNTQTGELAVKEVNGEIVRGIGTWDDEVTLDFSGDTPHYQDAGKSGEVCEVRIHEQHPEGGFWGDKYETIWEAE